MNRETLAEWCQRGIIGIVVAALVFAPLAFGSVRPQDFQYLMAGTALVLILWTARLWLLEEFRLHWPPAAWAVLAFMCYAGFAYWQAEVEYTARAELMRAAVYAVFFLAALNHSGGKDTPQIITAALIILGVGLAAYGIWQFVANSPQVWFIKVPSTFGRRATGTYINPNHFAGFLDLVIPLAMAYTIAGRMSHVTRIVLVYCALVMLAGLALTQSRGGWVATGCGLGMLLFVAAWSPRLRLPALVLGIAVAIGGAVFLNHSFAQKRIEEAKILSGDSSKGVRLMIWETAWKAWQTQPLLGIGPGHFDLRYREFRPARLVGRPEYAHNDYLNALTDWGVIGLTLALGFAGCMAVHSFQAVRGLKVQAADLVAKRGDRRPTASNRTAFVLGATGSFVALLVHSIFDFNLQIPANALILFVLLGTLAAHLKYTTNRHQFVCGKGSKALLTLSLIALASLGIAACLRVRNEKQALAVAQGSHSDLSQWRDAWRRAYDAEPKNSMTAQAIGELYRRSAWAGDDDYAKEAIKAMEWFHRAAELNPHDGFSLLRIGMCLHWIGRHQEAAPYFERAQKLDPNGYFTVAHLGWHQYQLKNYPEAKRLFENSLAITPWGVTNETARAYLGIVEQRLKEPAGDYVPQLTPR